MKFPEPESHTLEFKSHIPQNDQIIKTVIGFCNQTGGRLVLGVADDGTIVGVKEEEAMETMEWLEQAIFQASTPPIIPKVFTQRIGDKLIIVIQVSAGMSKPYYRRSEGAEQGVYVRVGRHTMRAGHDMIEELSWQSRGLSYDSMPVYQATQEELDHTKIQNFLERRDKAADVTVTDDVLKPYKLCIDEHSRTYPTVCGILLFGKRPDHWFSEAMIICTHYAGTSGREALATRDCKGTLFEQFLESFEFILSRIHRSFTIRGARREERYEIPEVAIREILLNAIIHRNYHHRAPIKISIYQDRVEIFSPGGFPTPFSNLKLGLTDTRNMAICRIFREAGYIEKLGTGLLTLFETYSKWNLPEPEVINGDHFVKCILPREGYGVAPLTDDLTRILGLFATSNDLAVFDVISAFHLPRATATRRLNELVSQQKLLKIGTGRGTRYRLNRSS